MCEDRQLAYVVEDYEGEEGDDDYKCCLVDALLHHDVDFAANHALDQQKHDHAAVKNGKRHQVEYAQVEADLRGELEFREPSLHLRGLTGHAGNPHWPLKLINGDPM